MVKEKEIGNLIVISGPSGAGKDSVVQKLLETNKNMVLSVSMTTRAPRKGEQEGVDYFYVTKEYFLEQIDKGNFLEYANVYASDYYGTPKDAVLDNIKKGKDVILVIINPFFESHSATYKIPSFLPIISPIFEAW